MKTSPGRDTRTAWLIPWCTVGHGQLQQCAGAFRAAVLFHQEQWTQTCRALPWAWMWLCTKAPPRVAAERYHAPRNLFGMCTPRLGTPRGPAHTSLQLGDGDHSVLWCWLSLMASSPHPLNAITHLREEELSCFPVPLQKLLYITACLQPETGVARASCLAGLRHSQLIRLSLPHHCRERDQPAPNPCYRSAAGVSNEVDPACASRL